MTQQTTNETTERELLDDDGENRALRSFLLQYGAPSITVGAMQQHMARSGWGAIYCPPFVANGNPGRHLTKAAAQIWIRHLLSMEARAALPPTSGEPLPRPAYDWCPECHARDSMPEPVAPAAPVADTGAVELVNCAVRAWSAWESSPIKSRDGLLFECMLNLHEAEKAFVAKSATPASPAPTADSAADARDAARYRWLRERRDIPHGARNIPWAVALDPAEKIHTMTLRAGVDLDAAIDTAIAAMQAQQKEE